MRDYRTCFASELVKGDRFRIWGGWVMDHVAEVLAVEPAPSGKTRVTFTYGEEARRIETADELKFYCLEA